MQVFHTQTQSGTYLLDASSGETLVHMQNLAGMLSSLLGEPFPEFPDLANAGVRTVLDLGCGPGSWVLDMARWYPSLSLTGVDNEPSLLAWAQIRAHALKLTSQISFEYLDVTQFPWPFEDHSFDLVHGRFLQSFLRTEHWPRVIQQCQRVLSPGGRIRFTEEESTVTNSPAYEHLHALLVQVLQQEGHSFSRDGFSNEITHLLVQAGFQEMKSTTHVIDYSVTSKEHYPISEVMLRAFAPSLLGKKIVQLGLLSAEAYQDLYAEAQREVLYGEDFCASTYFLTVSG